MEPGFLLVGPLFLAFFVLLLTLRIADLSDAHPNSAMKIEIFARRKMRKDQHIGFISELISVVCRSIFEAGPEGLLAF